MSLIKTNTGKIVMKDAEAMFLVPRVYNSTYGDYLLGNDVYDISAIIGDSTLVEQSDGDTVTKNNEFIASPLLEMSFGGKYGFTAQCLDLQNKIMKSVFGAMTVNGIEGLAAMNDDFAPIYALIMVRFRDEFTPDLLLPYVQMNSKLMVQQLKTRASQGNLAGTAKPTKVCFKNAAAPGNLLQFSVPSDSTTTYTPYTPVVFVPKTLSALVLHHKGSQNEVYSSINFETGAVSTDISVNPSNGTWVLL